MDLTVLFHVAVCAGAIGSRFKIDASYLSPNVNMAARLEAASRQYNTKLLLSGPMHSRLSSAVRMVVAWLRTQRWVFRHVTHLSANHLFGARPLCTLHFSSESSTLLLLTC